MQIGKKNSVVRLRFTVFDSAGAAVTGLTTGNFTIRIFNDSDSSAGGGIAVAEIGNGLYTLNFTPDAIGYWVAWILHTTHFPQGKLEDVVVYDRDLSELETTAESITLHQITSNAIAVIDGIVDDLRDCTILAELTVASGSSSTVVRTNATQANNFYDAQHLVIVNAAGRTSRRILSYSATNGSFTVRDAFPFTPASGNTAYVVGRVEPATPLELQSVEGTIDSRFDDVDADLVSILANLAVVDSVVDAILVDTDSTIPGLIAALPTAAQNADAVWDEATSGHATAGTFGKAITDILAAVGVLDGFTADFFAGAVWDALTASYTDSGSFGELMGLIFGAVDSLESGQVTINTSLALVAADVDDILTDTGTTLPAQITSEIDDVQADIAALSIPTAAAIADAVLDELLSGHTAAGTVGEALALIVDTLETFRNDAEVELEIGGTKLVTIYEVDGSTVKYQVRISADGLERERL